MTKEEIADAILFKALEEIEGRYGADVAAGSLFRVMKLIISGG